MFTLNENAVSVRFKSSDSICLFCSLKSFIRLSSSVVKLVELSMLRLSVLLKTIS